MYNDFFGFTESPFSIAPDPRYLFMSERHREALAHLLYGMRIDGGFVLLTGEVGTGKTTVCRGLLEQVPENTDVAFIYNPKLSTVELLATICQELHLQVPETRISQKAYFDLLNFHLLDSHARGRRTVLIIDEAQNLSDEVLEQVRLLTNLETHQRKLLQIILLGQPELRDRLARPELRQLSQRIVARYHLEPLSKAETAAYVGHRLAVAGAVRPVFAPQVMERIYRASGGTPRLINVICDRALLGAFVEGKTVVDRMVLTKATREVFGAPLRRVFGMPLRRAAVAAGLIVAGLGLVIAYQRIGTDASPPPAAPSPAVPSPPSPTGESLTAPPRPGAASAASLAWPAEKDHWLNEAQAVRALFALWGIETKPADIASACSDAGRQGLHCLSGTSDASALEAMNTPAVVTLRQQGGPDFHATLKRLSSAEADLLVAGEPRRVSREAFERQWTGEYTALWRGPAGDRRLLRVGSRGSDVTWIRNRLGRMDGRPVPPNEDSESVFDQELAQRVRQFQRDQGLDADGVAGPATLMRLAEITDATAPRLAAARPGKEAN
jgi:general secretion pathway protein A